MPPSGGFFLDNDFVNIVMSKKSFLTRYGTEQHIRAGLSDPWHPKISMAATNPLSKKEDFESLLKNPAAVRAVVGIYKNRGWEVPYEHVKNHFDSSSAAHINTRNHIMSVLTKTVQLPPDVLERMHCHAEPTVRMAAMENQGTTKEQVQRAIASDPDPSVRFVAKSLARARGW